MAKMIKCPTCGTQIEVPAGPGGQVIKCPGCGKGLKIVAKKPPQPGAGAGGSVAGGSMAGTVAGGSVSAMSFHDEPPSRDDLPSLDYTCQVCGTPTDPDRLVEDNGRLVCPDCVKGARSKIDRPEIAPDLMDFKRPAAMPARRGKLLRVTPSLVVAGVAGLIYIGCTVYLNLWEAPKGSGRAVASPVGPAVVPPTTNGAALTPEPTTPGASISTQTTQPSATQPAGEPPVALIPPIEPIEPIDDLPPVESTTTTAPAEPPAPGTIFSESPDAPPDQATTAPAPTAVAVGPNVDPPPAALPPSTDPLLLGIDKLQQKDYNAAWQQFEKARNKHRLLGRVVDPLTPEQQMVLIGLAAANIGRNQADIAMNQLNIVLGTPGTATVAPTPGKGTPTRSAVLNYAITVMSKRQATPGELGKAVDMVRAYLSRGGVSNDEYAADIFGTLLDRISAVPNVQKETLQQHVLFLDNYVSTLARDTRPNELKWGIEWKPREQVMNYRAARGRITPATPDQLQRELDAAKAKVMQLQQAVDQARATPGSDVIGAQNQYRDALANQKEIEMRIELAAAPAPKPKWLEKFQPVVPETTITQ